MADSEEIEKVMSILEANKEKGFVQRILTPDKYPVLPFGKGKVASHRMAWAEVDGKYRVFPTILFDGIKLNLYDSDTAFKHASETGNYIDFDNPDDADWFSRKYKSIWENNETK